MRGELWDQGLRCGPKVWEQGGSKAPSGRFLRRREEPWGSLLSSQEGWGRALTCFRTCLGMTRPLEQEGRTSSCLGKIHDKYIWILKSISPLQVVTTPVSILFLFLIVFSTCMIFTILCYELLTSL